MDVVVVGGGPVGCALARELGRYRLRAVLVEKSEDIGAQTGKANSAIVHTGFDAPPGSLESRLVTAAQPMYPGLAWELDFPYQVSGALLVATTDEEADILLGLGEKALANGVLDVHPLSPEQARELEPGLTPAARAALAVPRESITSPWDMARAMAENAVTNGVEVLLDTEVTAIPRFRGAVRGVETNRGFIAASRVVNAAGMFADQVAHLAGDCDFHITPRRGQFLVLDKNVDYRPRHILLPVPTPLSKGILVAPTVDGNLLAGPTAEDIQDRLDTRVTAAGLQEVFQGAARLLPQLDARDSITQYAGLRPVRHPDGYVLEASSRVPGLVNLSGIRSTGVTAAPAIASYVTHILAGAGLHLVPKPGFQPRRRVPRMFAEMSDSERIAAIQEDPGYGHVVCRCETVTEAEVVAAIRGPVGARSLDAIKRRTRAQAGRCQSGFCNPRVTGILARELGISPHQVCKRGVGSEVLVAPTRGGR